MTWWCRGSWRLALCCFSCKRGLNFRYCVCLTSKHSFHSLLVALSGPPYAHSHKLLHFTLILTTHKGVNTHFTLKCCGWSLLLGEGKKEKEVTACDHRRKRASKHCPVLRAATRWDLFVVFLCDILTLAHTECLSGPEFGCDLSWLILFELFLDLQCLKMQCLH